MLTASPASRHRIATGAAAVTLLVAGGLGVTASSNAAARIGDVLQTPVAPIAERLAPAAPMPPAPSRAAPPAPRTPAPPAPPVISRTEAGEAVIRTGDGKTYRLRDARRVIRVDKDGQVTTESDGGGDLPDVADVAALNCKEGDESRPVIQNERRTIICRNRVQRLADDGAAAEAYARGAVANALTSLRYARASIAAERNMPDGERRSALREIDQAIAEMKADMAAN